MIGSTFNLSNESGSDEDMVYELRFTGCVDSVDVREEVLAQMIPNSYVV